MQILCDVCSTATAALMCCADDAALCSQCDTRVHAANKLASKHQRVPLLVPGPEDTRVSCDICQEKVGYFFCVEDRALLCRHCDVSIHTSNRLASNHKRFLVPGILVGLQPSSRQNYPYSGGIDQVDSKGHVSSQLGSTTKGASEYKVASKCPTPASHHEAAFLEPVSTVQPTRGMNSSLQRASSVYMNALASQQSSQRSVACANVAGDGPLACPQPAQETFLPSRSSPPNGVTRSDGKIKKSSGEDLMVNSSVSEYFSDSVPGWKVDELLSFTEMGNSKKDFPSFDEAGWNSDFSGIDDTLFGESFAEVPSLPGPAADSRPNLKSAGSWVWKGKRSSDCNSLLDCDDALLVPDLDSLPPPLKRRTAFVEV